ncbi:GNAT family N-acetyltransferase [Cellulophaga sp. HaHaR_3_176]|uniref:GNAT family N-acetyltransferase n=1 Tax=Cellulophaga sp. HaHaR_3_176 TaxID=1942464 RepID=UPI001C1FFDEB|nr:GNAT family N-acetyltransferase [Cellulophaga sp. HaHaR_3_176]QWX85453.1 GNAT family N-acetyltransferase [Cellulophaga sp. HaHaR_3_176]
MPVEIISFKPEHAKSFKDLNIAWLEKYFYVEKKDIELLDGCEKNILDKGGYIYFAAYNNQIVGCFAFIQKEENVYELGKMAVDFKFQGLKIGQNLLKFAIDYAKKSNWSKIILYSSTKLEHALYLYKKFGFTVIELENNPEYLRSDLKMELLLN